MQHAKAIPEPWRSFLRELDQRATAETRLDCMGGFVVRMQYGFSRETSDLDVLVIAPREQQAALLELGARGGLLHKKYKVYLDYVGVAKLPQDYEERLVEMFPGVHKHLRLCALDPYDLALSKLERNIQRDRDECKTLGARRSIRFACAQRAVRKGATLANGKSGTRRFNIETVDGYD